jgi:hypothetical protein
MLCYAMLCGSVRKGKEGGRKEGRKEGDAVQLRRAHS